MSTLEAGLESLVMTGVVARVIIALLTFDSLYNEAAGLVVVTFVALVLEFVNGRNGGLRHLKPRSCKSSGFLLGALTLPLVQATRLVQQLRCSNAFKVSLLAEETLRFEFWLALACSTSMLMLLMSLLWKQRANGWISATLCEYLIAVMLVFATPMMKVDKTWLWLWGAVYVLGGKLLFSYVLHVFPSSGTVGEVVLVVEGIILYGVNAAISYLSEGSSVSGELDRDQHLISSSFQGIILGLLVIPFLCNLLYQSIPLILERARLVHFLGKGSREGLHISYKAGIFYMVLIIMIFRAVPIWLDIVFNIQLSPVLWSVNFILKQPLRRLLLCTYWVGLICTSLPLLYRVSVSGQLPNILIRKYYHVLVVFIFLPALLLDPIFLQLAFGVAVSAFLVIEMVRVWRFPPFGNLIEHFMTAFTDHRDSGVLIISHFSLLLGCALPVWLNSGSGDRPLASFAGILSLGIGDTMASVVGYNFGSIHVSSKSKKTLEGTLAGIVSVLVCFLLLIPMLSSASRPTVALDYLSLVAAVTITGVLEAYTLQLDNAFIPLVFYSLLVL